MLNIDKVERTRSMYRDKQFAETRRDLEVTYIADLDGEQFLLYPETAEPVIREFQPKNLSASGIRYQPLPRGTNSTM